MYKRPCTAKQVNKHVHKAYTKLSSSGNRTLTLLAGLTALYPQKVPSAGLPPKASRRQGCWLGLTKMGEEEGWQGEKRGAGAGSTPPWGFLLHFRLFLVGCGSETAHLP
ncbi:hypothetical protein I79_013853 [Cricetulus griseus]|uniref:Uncharacterized protein n=1 Tax=Cricetulus griseus TaxID=10029 RepID=G3HSL9_CRIGR|nr:hypothetical protein I79_013853 [Cricetulus griseus]